MRFPWRKKKEPDKQFPPVPDWRPGFHPDIEELVDRFSYYTDRAKDFVVLKNGTIVFVDNGLDTASATQQARETIDAIYNYHPDMNPQPMDDGNILVSYNHPAYNIAIEPCAQRHWKEIDRNHMLALCTDEVLITPAGNNVFDEFGKKALWARCYFFMDAQDFEIVRIIIGDR
jgi:hypothetical protein